MVKIRLARYGKTNDPFYRIVAVDERKKRSGKSLEIIGFWNPRENSKKIDKKKLEKWIKNGAQISQAVKKLLE
jgi:small subunit ribosomal protein S16